jgi:hypothetical protein
MIDDIVKATRDNLAERLTSPLLGSFAVSWVLWNYKFLVILLSDAGVTQTFTLIEAVAFPDWASVLLRGVVCPLAVALTYVFVYPYPARYVYAYTLKRQRETSEVKRLIEGATLLTLDESRALRQEHFQAEIKNKGTIDRLNAEISRLGAELEAMTKEVAGRQELEPAERLYGSISASQLALLKKIGELGDGALWTTLLNGSPEPRVQTEFDIGELERRKLVRKIYLEEEEDSRLVFTHDGRRVLLNEGKLGD